jgi:hypothetical protein
MRLPTLFSAGIFLLGSTWACFGQDDRTTDPVTPGPQMQNPVLQSPDPSPDAAVLGPPNADFGVWEPLPFVPSYGFDLLDVGRACKRSCPCKSAARCRASISGMDST